jgi:hypothetical protein
MVPVKLLAKNIDHMLLNEVQELWLPVGLFAFDGFMQPE